MLTETHRRLLRRLNKTVTLPPDKWPTKLDLYSEFSTLLPDAREDLTARAFFERLRTIIRGILQNADLVGDAIPVAFDGVEILKPDLDTLNWVKPTKGIQLRLGLLHRYIDKEFPQPVGAAAYEMFLDYRQIMEQQMLPTAHDLDEVEEHLEQMFGVQSPISGAKVDPLSIRDPDSGRRLRDLVVHKFESRPQQQSKDRLNTHLHIIRRSYLRGMMISVDYLTSEREPAKTHIIDIVAVTASVKNGGVYLHGVAADRVDATRPRCGPDGSPRMITLKMSRIARLTETTTRGVLKPTDLANLLQSIKENDGLYIADNKSRIPEVIAKVTPEYGRYLEEGMPFHSAKRIDERQLVALKQPRSAVCYRICDTNFEHLVSEVFRSRGRMVVLTPSHIAEDIHRNLQGAAACQGQLEPLGIANLAGSPRITGAASMRAASLPPMAPPASSGLRDDFSQDADVLQIRRSPGGASSRRPAAVGDATPPPTIHLNRGRSAPMPWQRAAADHHHGSDIT